LLEKLQAYGIKQWIPKEIKDGTELEEVEK